MIEMIEMAVASKRPSRAYILFKSGQQTAIGNAGSRVLQALVCVPPVVSTYAVDGDVMFVQCGSCSPADPDAEHETPPKVAVRWFVHGKDGVESTAAALDVVNSRSSLTVLFSHGNAIDLGGCDAYCRWAAQAWGCNIVTYDFFNYGLSDKRKFSEHALHRAAHGVLKHTLQMCPDHTFFLLGKSLGSVPSVWMAAHDELKTRVAGVVLVSPLASGARTMCDISTFPSFIRHWADGVFGDSIERMPYIECPILIIHGTEDTIVPVQNARDLFFAISSRSPPPILLEAGHNDIETRHGNVFLMCVQEFMAAVGMHQN